MKLIVPAAGKSSRFPNIRPKWTLTHPNGEMMFIEAIKGLPLKSFENIYLTVLKSHLDQFKLEKGIRKSLDRLGVNYELTILDEATKSQSETVFKTLEQNSITGPFLVKDSDNHFAIDEIEGNSICVYDIESCGKIYAANKSYIEANNDGIINNIIEKKIISSTFCVGGYAFEDAAKFITVYKELEKENRTNELYISHIVFKMILDGEIFIQKFVTNYKDWGTLDDWEEYTSQYKTIFIDLDGVLVENSGEYVAPYWGETKGLPQNIAFINEMYDSGKVKIIITTSRKSEYGDQTVQQLQKEGIKYHHIIFDLLHTSSRILINDWSDTNPYKTCDSINIRRNTDELDKYLR